MGVIQATYLFIMSSPVSANLGENLQLAPPIDEGRRERQEKLDAQKNEHFIKGFSFGKSNFKLIMQV